MYLFFLQFLLNMVFFLLSDNPRPSSSIVSPQLGTEEALPLDYTDQIEERISTLNGRPRPEHSYTTTPPPPVTVTPIVPPPSPIYIPQSQVIILHYHARLTRECVKRRDGRIFFSSSTTMRLSFHRHSRDNRELSTASLQNAWASWAPQQQTIYYPQPRPNPWANNNNRYVSAPFQDYR